MMMKEKRIGNQNGFTLIEVILSMAILGIILVAFLNMFSFSMIGLFRARDKSIALNEVQGSVESQLATEDAFHSDEIILTFDDEEITITGGYIETEKSSGLSSSEITGFIPFIPTIETFPKTIIEGTPSGYEITVEGNDTSFSEDTKVEILDRELTQILYEPSFEYISLTSGSFDITSDLFNENGDYIIRTTTVLPDGKKEISRSKLTVLMPKLIAVTDNNIYVSHDGSSWINRKNDTYPIPLFDQLEQVIYVKGEYVAVGGSTLLKSSDFSPWSKISMTGASGVSGVTFSNGYYYISTENGSILQSANGTIWTNIFSDSKYSFVDIHSTGDSKVFAVGKDDIGRGIVLLKDSTGFSHMLSESEDIAFNSITSHSIYDEISNSWSHIFAVAGTGGYIYTSADGISWEQKYSNEEITLNDIYYADLNSEYAGPKWIAVGENGVLLESVDSETWSRRQIGDENLNSVYVSGKRVFIAGDNGTIIKSDENNLDYFTINKIGTENFQSIVGR